MPQATAYDATPTVNTIPRGVGSLPRILPAAVVLVAACGLVATTMLDDSADVTIAQRLAPAPSAMPTVAATGSTTVPDASVVFSGREVEGEEPIPTF